VKSSPCGPAQPRSLVRAATAGQGLFCGITPKVELFGVGLEQGRTDGFEEPLSAAEKKSRRRVGRRGGRRGLPGPLRAALSERDSPGPGPARAGQGRSAPIRASGRMAVGWLNALASERQAQRPDGRTAESTWLTDTGKQRASSLARTRTCASLGSIENRTEERPAGAIAAQARRGRSVIVRQQLAQPVARGCAPPPDREQPTAIGTSRGPRLGNTGAGERWRAGFDHAENSARRLSAVGVARESKSATIQVKGRNAYGWLQKPGGRGVHRPGCAFSARFDSSNARRPTPRSLA